MEGFSEIRRRIKGASVSCQSPVKRHGRQIIQEVKEKMQNSKLNLLFRRRSLMRGAQNVGYATPAATHPDLPPLVSK